MLLLTSGTFHAGIHRAVPPKKKVVTRLERQLGDKKIHIRSESTLWRKKNSHLACTFIVVCDSSIFLCYICTNWKKDFYLEVSRYVSPEICVFQYASYLDTLQ